MEITEAFQQQSSSAKSPIKKSTNCNGHSMQGYCDGEISFIPLQERGISIKGKNILSFSRLVGLIEEVARIHLDTVLLQARKLSVFSYL